MIIVKKNNSMLAVVYKDDIELPDNVQKFTVDSIPPGEGILKTDGISKLWWEPIPEPPPPPPPSDREILETLIPNQSNPLQAAEQLRRTMVMYASSLDDDRALEVATIYPEWQAGVAYKTKDIISYGANPTGDSQLYRVVKDHTSQSDWIPGVGTESLYTAFGLTPEGYPVWKQPAGAHDAYNTGDIVDYNGKLYRSKIDGNVYSPEAYPQGWELYTP